MTGGLHSEDLSDDDTSNPSVTFPRATDANPVNLLLSNTAPKSLIEGEDSDCDQEDEGLNQARPRSWVWTHGNRLEYKTKFYWKCNYCKRFSQS
jgi:hypothetical protein